MKILSCILYVDMYCDQYNFYEHKNKGVFQETNCVNN